MVLSVPVLCFNQLILENFRHNLLPVLHPVLRRPVFSIITFAGFIELGPVLHPVRHDLDLILGLSFGIGPTVLLETSLVSFRMDSVRSLFTFFIGNNAILKT